MNWYGSKGPIDQIITSDWTPAKGVRLAKVWIGAIERIQEIELELQSLRIAYRADYNAMPARIEAYYDAADLLPTDAALTAVWTLDANNAQRSIWEHPKILAIRATSDVDGAAQFRAEIDKAAQTGKISSAMAALIAQIPDLGELLVRWVMGDETYMEPQYVLRHTATYSHLKTFSYDYAAVNKLILSAALASQEPTIPFALPDCAWLSQGPRQEQLSNGRIQVTREWWESDYDTWKYGTA